MLATERPQFVNADQEGRVVKAQSDVWLTVWTSMLILNMVCCVAVWLTSLGADCVRQLLAGVLAGASAFLSWRADAKRTQDSESNSHKPTVLATAALTTTCLVIFASGNLHTARAYLMANITLLTTFTWTFFGWQRCKVLIPAFFLLLFVLPDLPEEFRAYLFIPLQHLCTITAGEVARLFVPLTYSGHTFNVDGHIIDVAPSCAGLGMWACFLFAFAIWQAFKKYRPAAYIAAFLTDPILTLTLNTVRIALTIIVAHYQSVRLALEIHSKLEYVLVPLGLFVLWKVGACFAKSD